MGEQVLRPEELVKPRLLWICIGSLSCKDYLVFCRLRSCSCPWGYNLHGPLSPTKLPFSTEPVRTRPWSQKLVFNRVNGKRPQVLPQHVSAPEECYTLAHEENVRFVYEAWQQVEQQLDDSQRGENVCGPVQYVEKTPNPGLKNFVPIDLEEWWAQQFLAKIENCS
uniref:MAPK regulated corepressor interacting protein 2 n=1 Tax=Apteryx owenii TaxID=8824 RepID=A0A8B9Q4Q7_APTOW